MFLLVEDIDVGKVHLSESELEQFPTIMELTTRMGEWDPNVWGLCYNQDTNSSSFASCFYEGWKLWHSMQEIYEGVCAEFGEEYDPEKIRFVYFVGKTTKSGIKPVLEYHFHEEGDNEEEFFYFGANFPIWGN